MVATPEQAVINGYRVFPVPLRHGPFSRFMYIKVNKDKTGENEGQVLFVANLDQNSTEEHLEQLFASCGTIQSISVSRGSGKDYESRFAHVLFKSTKGVAAAMAMPAPAKYAPLTKELGVAKWVRQSQNSHASTEDLQEDVDSFIRKFEQEEAEAKVAAEKSAEPDDDGFVTVTRKTRPREEIKAPGGHKKKKKGELKNFYRFQIREGKRNQLMELREKFTKDKEKIDKMKGQRKFMPF
jgi:ribosomal RNA-processing protein 7